jgi:type IV pilus assembly protein PilM
MPSLHKQKTVVGLDIEAGSAAATELRVNGESSVAGYGSIPLDAGIFRDGEVVDPGALADALKDLFGRNKLSKNVRFGIANQRVAVRTLRLPPLEDPAELETAIRFQAQEHIPMPLEQAVLDWQVIGQSVGENGERSVEVVVVAGRRDMLTACMEALTRAGLRPVGIDHSAFGMIRALHREQPSVVGAAEFVEAPIAGATAEREAVPTATLYCNLGDVTNLAVARGNACLFARMATFGVEGIAQKLAEQRGLTLEHARQWLTHVGLESPTEQIDGDQHVIGAAREGLAEGAAKLADELRLSLDFYGQQEGAVPVDGVVACGPGIAIPGLVERLQVGLGQPVNVGRPAALGRLDDNAAARLTLSYGLALDE